jgi:hypothetical protein
MPQNSDSISILAAMIRNSNDLYKAAHASPAGTPSDASIAYRLLINAPECITIEREK